MVSKATTVEEYLAELPPDRREAIEAVRKVILKNLDKGFQEIMQYGGIGYAVPHSLYPNGYHCDPKQPLPFIGLGSQKHHMSLGMFCLYLDADEMKKFQEEYVKSGKRMDMGKSCVRFKKLEDLPLDVVGRAVKRVTLKKFIAHYESCIPNSAKPKK